MASKTFELRAWEKNTRAVIFAVQGEAISRTVTAKLLDSGGQPVDLTLSSARLYVYKPDKTIVYLPGTITDAPNGIVSFLLDSQVAAAPGTGTWYVIVTQADGGALEFTGMQINIAPANLDSAVESTNEFTALQEAIKIVQNIDNRVPKTTTVCSKALTANISLAAADVGAIPADSAGAANGVMKLPATLPTEGRILKAGAGGTVAEAEADKDYATINGFESITATCIGTSGAAYVFQITGMQPGGVYLAAITTEYNPAGSPLYLSPLCLLITVPTGYQGTSITMGCSAKVIDGFYGTGYTRYVDANVSVAFGAQGGEYYAYVANPVVLVTVLSSGSTLDVPSAKISVKKLI